MARLKTGDVVRLRWVHDGEQVRSLDAGPVTRTGVIPIEAYLSFGPNPFPGGDWRCEISGPVNASKGFRGGGPSGPVLYASACEGTHVVDVGGAEACVKDEGGMPLARPESVHCSAVLTRVGGREVRVEVVFNGQFQAGPSRSTGFTKHDAGSPDITVLSVGLKLSGIEMTLRPGPLPPGPYACRWLIDGKEVGRRAFTVT